MGTRILILGHDEPGSLMHSYARGFSEHGASVDMYCLASALRSVTRLPRRRLLDSALARRRGAALSRKVVEDLRSRDADLVLVLKGEHLQPQAVAAFRTALRCPVLNLYPDDPFSELSVNRLAFGAQVLREYDGCFTYSQRLVRAYRDAGVSQVEWLPFARDPGLHAPPCVKAQPEADIVFVGNLDRSRADWLAGLKRFRVVIYGSARANRRMIRARAMRNAVLRPAVFGGDMATALGRGAISLNLLRQQNKGSHNMRSFESLACGAFTISEDSAEIQSLFAAGREVVTVSKPADLAPTVRRWLRDPEGRAQVAAAGFKRVEHDTYARRSGVLLEQWLG